MAAGQKNASREYDECGIVSGEPVGLICSGTCGSRVDRGGQWSGIAIFKAIWHSCNANRSPSNTAAGLSSFVEHIGENKSERRV